MNTLIKTALVLGIISFLPTAGYAAGAEAPNTAQHRMLHPTGDLAKATALAPPRGAVVAPSAALPETDGLSRSDEDCKMGCIDH
jgi:hypothetical protein